MFNEKYAREYLDILKQDEEKYFKDYQVLQERVKHSNAIYRGEPVPVTYQGLMYDENTKKHLGKISKQLMQITRKITEKYIEDPEYRKLFGFDKKLEELILVDPKYPVPVPICRYDIFYEDEDNFMFCEFNTDGASAMNEDNTIGPLLLETKGMKEFSKEYSLENVDMIYSWAKTSVEMYRKYWKDENPRVAIVDILDLGTPHEFEEFRKAYEAQGIQCKICDARDLEYRDGKLYAGEDVIDLVYRRLVTVELMRHYDEVQGLIEGYKNNAFMMLGSIRSQIMHTKLLYKVFRLPETKAILSQEENEFLDQHIPYTEEFLNEEDFKEVLGHKDDYILKPKDEYASHGIYAGREHSQEEWEKILKEILGKEYIYQRYYDMKPLLFAEFDQNGHLQENRFGAVVGMFIYNEQFIAPYTRIGQQTLISGARKYYTAPNILIHHKEG